MDLPGEGEYGPSPVMTGWVVYRPHCMFRDPDLVAGAVCAVAEYDRDIDRWVVTARVASMIDLFHTMTLNGFPGYYVYQLPRRTTLDEMARTIRRGLQETALGPLDLLEVPYPDAKLFVDCNCYEPPYAWTSGPSPVNTRIDYLYRDGMGNSTLNTAVVAGALSEDEARSALGACEHGPVSRLFIPSQVGLPERRDGGGGGAFFEIDEASFALTVACPTVGLSAPGLLSRFESLRGKWDVAAALRHHHGHDGEDAPQR